MTIRTTLATLAARRVNEPLPLDAVIVPNYDRRSNLER